MSVWHDFLELLTIARSYTGDITAISSFVMMVTLILVAYEWKRLSKERFTIDLLRYWTDHLSQQCSSSRHLLWIMGRESNHEAIRDLYAKKAFTVRIPRDQKEYVDCLLTSVSESLQDSFATSLTQQVSIQEKSEGPIQVKVTERESIEIRWHVISFLNRLETVMKAWDRDLVDRHVIEEEFKPFMEPGSPDEGFDKFLAVARADNDFKAVSKFCKHVRNRRDGSESGHEASWPEIGKKIADRAVGLLSKSNKHT